MFEKLILELFSTLDITENELWDHFQDCGEIENVRVIRDSKTGMGKGFGYIKFQVWLSYEFVLVIGTKHFSILDRINIIMKGSLLMVKDLMIMILTL